MMFGFFNNKPLLTEDSVQWLFDTFAWSLENFDSDVFYNETILVVPSNKYFPGRANGIHGMARLIFEQVKEYAGLKHWPCVLVDQSSYVIEQTPKVMIEGALRGSKGIVSNSVEDGHRLPITYDPRQVNNPETLIATYAHALAHYLGSMARQPPPGDKEHWLYATEILAVFMGFGLMFANSAFTFTSSCGSCRNPTAGRSASLSEDEATYALAIFCVLKEIPAKEVRSHLKGHLRSFFKNAVKEIGKRKDQLERLHEL